MKAVFTIISMVFFLPTGTDLVPVNQVPSLTPCPFSPNCVSTLEKRQRKSMPPLVYNGSYDSAIYCLEKMLAKFENAELINKQENYYHYEFKTDIGNFVDDVEFLIDSVLNVIHFRSASRKGFGDFGKNRRRMNMLTEIWLKQN